MSLSRTAFFEQGAVACEQPLASMAGSDLLRAGGNAFDAAVATSYALAVTFHPAGGIGGDFFAMIYEAKKGRVHCLNSSGWAPSGLTVDLLKSKGEREVPIMGPYSAMIPGTVGGMAEIHRKFGSVASKRILAPAIKLAKKGFPAGEGICRSIAETYDTLSAPAKKVFAPGGAPPSPGDWIRQERLGDVIETISRGGPRAFYGGWPAEKICERLTELGVETKKRDLSGFRPEWVQPLKFVYNGTTVYEHPPNSMGATSLLMLKYLSGRDLSKWGPLSQERMRLTLEAAEFAYAKRDEMLGDPRFGPIDMDRFMQLQPASERFEARSRGEQDTTTFSVVDKEGNIVSVAQSLFHHFGSRVFIEDCGIMLNSRGVGFRLSGPNKVEPRKRPLHTLSCLLLDRGDGPEVALGTSGGEWRPLQHALFVTNMVDYHMSLEKCISHPRFVWSKGKLVVAEAGFEPADLPGYQVERVEYPGRTGSCHGIEILPEAKKAVCDTRGDGLPSGY